MSERSEGTYVYGVVPASASLEALEGAQDLPQVAVLESGDVAAIVSDAPDGDEAAMRDAVVAHARVLAAAVQDAPVIPFQFGTVLPNDEAVRDELLGERHDQLAELLKKLEDRVQMTLKVYYHEEAILREVLEEEPEISRLREATRDRPEEEVYDARVRLGELVNTAIVQRAERDSAEILERLTPLAVTHAVEPQEKELMLLNAPFLVERGKVQEFEAAVEETAQERQERMHFKLIGPMPAYHFIDEGEPAWA